MKIYCIDLGWLGGAMVVANHADEAAAIINEKASTSLPFVYAEQLTEIEIEIGTFFEVEGD